MFLYENDLCGLSIHSAYFEDPKGEPFPKESIALLYFLFFGLFV